MIATLYLKIESLSIKLLEHNPTVQMSLTFISFILIKQFNLFLAFGINVMETPHSQQ